MLFMIPSHSYHQKRAFEVAYHPSIAPHVANKPQKDECERMSVTDSAPP